MLFRSTVQPQHYELHFDIDLRAGTFSGTEVVQVALGEPTARIALHAVDLTMLEASVEREGALQAATVYAETASRAARDAQARLDAAKAAIKAKADAAKSAQTAAAQNGMRKPKAKAKRVIRPP